MNYTLATAKNQLELHYGKTMKLISQLEEEMRKTGGDWTEQAQLRNLREQAARMQRAKERKSKGNYGCCLSCNCPIDPERLTLVPEAELCMNCHQENVRNVLHRRQSIRTYN